MKSKRKCISLEQLEMVSKRVFTLLISLGTKLSKEKYRVNKKMPYNEAEVFNYFLN